MNPIAELLHRGRGAAAALRGGLPLAFGLLGAGAQALADDRSAVPQVQLSAVPGKDNELRFGVQCHTDPPGRRCKGGNVVAGLTYRPTQSLRGAWSDAGGACITNTHYLSCRIGPNLDGATQWVHFTLHVEPQEYAAQTLNAQGADGLDLPLTSMRIDMHGEGTLELTPPKDVVLPETTPAASTRLSFSNAGPSVNRGVTIRIGPFPRYLQPWILADWPDCRISGGGAKTVLCGPFDLGPQQRGKLNLNLIGVPEWFPDRLPAFAEIDVDASSDLGHSRTRFLASVVPAQAGN